LRRYLFVLGVAACSAPADDTIDITHDVCAPITVGALAASELQRTGIDAAIELWAERGISTLRQSPAPAIEIRFEDAAPAFHGVYDDETGVVFINRSLTDPAAVAVVIAHELGHAFGLGHVATRDRASVMNPGNLVTPPSEADARELDLLWGACGR
jgi:hypothetical protein